MLNMKSFEVLLHALSLFLGVFTSEMQTERIIKNTKKYEMTSLMIKLVGIIVAGGGTLFIINKVSNEATLIRENNEILKRK